MDKIAKIYASFFPILIDILTGTPIAVSSKIEENCFILSVSDRGRGMTTAQIEKIGAHLQFDCHKYEGMGLGFYKA